MVCINFFLLLLHVLLALVIGNLRFQLLLIFNSLHFVLDGNVMSSSYDDSILETTTIAYFPTCPDGMKPIIGQKFSNLEDGVKFYKVYASVCGFDVRMGTRRKSDDGVVKHRYVLCNREGERLGHFSRPVQSDDDSNKKRKTRSTKASCGARVVFKLCGAEGYEIVTFNEAHSHPLLQDNQKQFLKLNRQMDYTHQSFVMSCRRANIGPVRSFKLFKELAGSYDKIGCSRVDFKNFSRDMRSSVIGLDTQVILDDLQDRHDLDPGNIFDYVVNDQHKLTRLFWADCVSIQNYKRFGETVSFDATYSTNQIICKNVYVDNLSLFFFLHQCI